MLLAPLTGCRCSELANLRPTNVREEGGVWYIAIERDPKRQRLEEETEGKTSKRAKTRTSLRSVLMSEHQMGNRRCQGFRQLIQRWPKDADEIALSHWFGYDLVLFDPSRKGHHTFQTLSG